MSLREEGSNGGVVGRCRERTQNVRGGGGYQGYGGWECMDQFCHALSAWVSTAYDQAVLNARFQQNTGGGVGSEQGKHQ